LGVVVLEEVEVLVVAASGAVALEEVVSEVVVLEEEALGVET
jgi:hypothetical protein